MAKPMLVDLWADSLPLTDPHKKLVQRFREGTNFFDDAIDTHELRSLVRALTTFPDRDPKVTRHVRTYLPDANNLLTSIPKVVNKNFMCCGMAELYGVNQPDYTLENFMARIAYETCGPSRFFIGTPNWGIGLIAYANHNRDSAVAKGTRLLKTISDFIAEHGLGRFDIVRRPVKNPNSGNWLYMGRWDPVSHQTANNAWITWTNAYVLTYGQTRYQYARDHWARIAARAEEVEFVAPLAR